MRLAKDFSGVSLAARNGEVLQLVAAEVRSNGADPLLAWDALKASKDQSF